MKGLGFKGLQEVEAYGPLSLWQNTAGRRVDGHDVGSL